MVLKNIKCEISYDGSEYCGYQIQPKLKTIQGEIQKVLTEITKSDIKVYASGRTDTGVHAKKQVINFYHDSNIPSERWAIALNMLLPDDIVVNTVEEMPLDFHARYDVRVKTYRYSINNQSVCNVFRRDFTLHYPYFLDVGLMNNASKLYIGSHDFSSYSSVKAKLNRERIIYDSEVWKEGDEIIFQISGNGFLHNMVRILMGTLIQVGNGKISADEFQLILEKKDRKLAGYTVPAKGLTLWDVIY
ncbi:MAG: tRNA pseudouridine(38-40) synthase TruA [Vulcanibacillus sp.]